MTQLKIIKLNFNAPLHISKGKNEYDSSEQLVHSDTLKSALYVMAKRLGLKEAESGKGFFDKFALSSAFPYIGEEYFFPKPMVKLPFTLEGLEGKKAQSKQAKILKKVKDKKAQSKQAKILKKLEYIGKSLFEKVLKGEEYEFEKWEVLAKGKMLSNHSQFEPNSQRLERQDRTYKAEQAGRVFIPPLGSEEAPMPFYMERLHFAENAGLYVVVDAVADFYSETLLPALRLLADEGIGTRRHLGNGTFDLEEAEMTLELPAMGEARHWMNLGLYCPTHEEWKTNREALKESSFGLMKRGGWLSSPEVETNISFRKQSLYMFSEGSVFAFGDWKGKGMIVRGDVKDIAPEIVDVAHEVWRDGTSVFVPISI
ncbi:MAG: type III-A CRISPR-associated RAMP protein Csm4 [Chitinophagales bacterium]